MNVTEARSGAVRKPYGRTMSNKCVSLATLGACLILNTGLGFDAGALRPYINRHAKISLRVPGDWDVTEEKLGLDEYALICKPRYEPIKGVLELDIYTGVTPIEAPLVFELRGVAMELSTKLFRDRAREMHFTLSQADGSLRASKPKRIASISGTVTVEGTSRGISGFISRDGERIVEAIFLHQTGKVDSLTSHLIAQMLESVETR